MPRTDRRTDELRPVTFETGFLRQAAASCVATFGLTRVLCAVSIEESVPAWMAGKGRGWVTAEYNMLPASTPRRKAREGRKGGGIDGRTAEIQRLVGRALRPIVDLNALGERTLWVDCDVLEADAGTRCASVCGAYVALAIAAKGLVDRGLLRRSPLRGGVAAVSVSILDGIPHLDPDYSEDVGGDADMNIVLDDQDRVIEWQTTAEGVPVTEASVAQAFAVAKAGIAKIRALQAAAVSGAAR